MVAITRFGIACLSGSLFAEVSVHGFLEESDKGFVSLFLQHQLG
jgi:hypothetical protein